jgi:hypothetical protein
MNVVSGQVYVVGGGVDDAGTVNAQVLLLDTQRPAWTVMCNGTHMAHGAGVVALSVMNLPSE